VPAIGDTLHQGESDTMTFRTDPDHEDVEVEATYAAMRDVRPPVHCHPHQHEHFEVLSGELTFALDGREIAIGAGQTFDIPRGIYHTVWNDSVEHTTFRWRTSPALRTPQMYETLWGLAARGEMGRHGNPPAAFLQNVALMWRYRREYRLARPDPRLALPLCAALAPVAWACGYRGHRAPTGSLTPAS
jgi:quercetin dioxygenase-like cupin family protein